VLLSDLVGDWHPVISCFIATIAYHFLSTTMTAGVPGSFSFVSHYPTTHVFR